MGLLGPQVSAQLLLARQAFCPGRHGAPPHVMGGRGRVVVVVGPAVVVVVVGAAVVVVVVVVGATIVPVQLPGGWQRELPLP